MPSAISLINNARQLAVSHPTYTGVTGAVDPSYPASNLLIPDPSRVTRYWYNLGANAYEYVVIDFGATLTGPFRAFGLQNCRFVASGTGGLLSFGFTNTAQSLYYGSQTFALSSLAPNPGTTDRYDLFGLLPADITCNKIELLFRPGNAASGLNYFELGYPFAGPALVFPDGSDSAWSTEPVDPSRVTRGRGGAFASSKIPSRKRLVMPFSVQNYAAMFGVAGSPSTPSFFNLLHEAGLSTPVLVVHRSNDAHAMQRLSVYGAITRLPQIQHQGDGYYESVLEVEQIR